MGQRHQKCRHSYPIAIALREAITITMDAQTEHQHFMAYALERAWTEVRAGNRPIFCLVVKDGQIVGHGPNTVARDDDPTAHGEVNAIRNACTRLRTINLAGCTLYTPMEPCPMCLATVLEAKIERLVLGARHLRVGRKDLGDYSVASFLTLVKRDLDVVSGMREAECEQLRNTWTATRALTDIVAHS